MTRILCYLHTPDEGGVERTALRLCAAWAMAGEDVRVAIGRRHSRALPRFCFALPGAAWLVGRMETFWMIAWLPWLTLRMRPDILFCAGNTYAIQAVIVRLLLGRFCPPIVAKISNDLDRPDLGPRLRRIYRWWCRLQGRHIDRLVALSPAMKRDVIRLMQVAPDRVLVIANPVLDGGRIDALAAAGRRAAESRGAGRRFVAIGRLTPQKDFGALLAAFHRAARPGDRLTVAGAGPEEMRLRAQIEALGLDRQVAMIGHCAAVEELLAASDILVLSSRYEGLPGVVIEAMAAGLAIVATDCCSSMADLLDRGARGTLVPVGDGEALARALAAADHRAAFDDDRRVQAYRVEHASRAYAQAFASLGGRAIVPAGRPRPLPL